jgi:hypothetical protein
MQMYAPVASSNAAYGRSRVTLRSCNVGERCLRCLTSPNFPAVDRESFLQNLRHFSPLDAVAFEEYLDPRSPPHGGGDGRAMTSTLTGKKSPRRILAILAGSATVAYVATASDQAGATTQNGVDTYITLYGNSFTCCEADAQYVSGGTITGHVQMSSGIDGTGTSYCNGTTLGNSNTDGTFAQGDLAFCDANVGGTVSQYCSTFWGKAKNGTYTDDSSTCGNNP